MEFTNQNISIYTCQFQAYVQKAKVQIKFPCNYFIQWKANNGKIIISSHNRYQANKSQIQFKECLVINVNVLYDKINKRYLKKQSLLMINLISKSRPDQIKLVGRVAIDLADVLNDNMFTQITSNQLQYCSVEASMNFKIKKISVKQSTLHVSELDRSSFNEYMTFQAALKPNQQLVHRNEGSSTHRDFDQQRSFKGSQQRQIRSLGRDKNKMSASSLNKQVFTPSTSIIRNDIVVQNKMNRSNIQRSNSIPVNIQKENSSKLLSPSSMDQEMLNEGNENNFSFHHNKNQQQNQSESNGQMMQRDRNSLSALKRLQSDNLVNSVKKDTQQTLLKQQIYNKKISLVNGIADIKSIDAKKIQTLKQSNAYQRPVIEKKVIELSKSLQPRQNQQSIKKVQTSLQISIKKNQKKQSSLLNFNNDSSLHSFRSANGNGISYEIQKSNQQSKRIISLTQALHDFQNKYTKITIQTQQLRASWKKQKQELHLNSQRFQNILSIKQKQIREKTKRIQTLQANAIIIQKKNNDQFGDVIWLKSQLENQKKQVQKYVQQKVNASEEVKRLQTQVRFLSELNSENQTQLNQSFVQRLSMYQNQIKDLQNRVKGEENTKRTLQAKFQISNRFQTQLKQKINSLEIQYKSLNKQLEQSRKSILQSHSQNFRLSEQKQQLKRLLQDKQHQLDQKAQQLLSTKGEQISQLYKQKQIQLNNIKAQFNSDKQKLNEQYKSITEQNETIKKQQNKKIQHHQNTILLLSQQLTSYQNEIKRLNQSLKEVEQSIQTKDNLINQLHQSQQQIYSTNNQTQKQTQQTILNLGRQLQAYTQSIIQKDKQITHLNTIFHQKDVQLLKHHQDLQSTKAQLQITKAKIFLYDRKILQLQQAYQQQLQTLQVQHSQQLYQLQSHYQDEITRYKQVEQIKQMLKESLQQWQNKCSDDKIASSKVVSKLNQMIKEKQDIMTEMQRMMKQLQREKLNLVEQTNGQVMEYQQTIAWMNNKHVQIRQFLQVQQSQFLNLYKQVKQQRDLLNGKIKCKIEIQIQLTKQIQTLKLNNSQLKRQIQNLTASLLSNESTINQLKSESQYKLSAMQKEHNQELEEYEERVKQLVDISQQKDSEILEKEVMMSQWEREKGQKQLEIDSYSKQIEVIRGQLKESKQDILKITKQKQYSEENNLSFIQTLEKQRIKYIQLQNTLLANQQTVNKNLKSLQSHIVQLQQSNQNLTNQIVELNTNISDEKSKLILSEQDFKINLQNLKAQHLTVIQQVKSQQLNKQSQLLTKIKQLYDQINQKNQTLLEKNIDIQSLSQQKQQLQSYLNSLKSQRQTFTLINYKQQIQKYKSQIKSLQFDIVTLKNQANKIPSLQRSLKIKNIQLNSLKYRLTTNYTTETVDPDQVSHIEEIITLKNQEIQILKKENQKIKELQLQLYQVQSLNQSLYQDIQQYEQEKFHLSSQQNQKDIRIAELREETQTLINTKHQLKEKLNQVQEKLKYYETLILDFKGHQISSTQSQSDKMNKSLGGPAGGSSSNKIPSLNNNNNNNESSADNQNTSSKINIQTLRKKIKILEIQIHRYRAQQEQFMNKIEQNSVVIRQLEEKLKLKDIEINKLITQKAQQTTTVGNNNEKPKIQYRNPQQVVQTFKEIQGLLKKRNQFHNLEKILIKIVQMSKQSGDEKVQLNDQNKRIISTQLLTQINTLSTQFQNVKAKIMKLEGKNYQEKAKLISLLKPCEESIRVLAKMTDS